MTDKLDWQIVAEKWRRGELVHTTELGGLGPGYEQTIQVLLFEVLARWEGSDPNWTLKKGEYPPEFESHYGKVLKDLDGRLGGLSGSQAGTAKNTAFQFMHYGYDYMMKDVKSDRRIMVTKDFPMWELPAGSSWWLRQVVCEKCSYKIVVTQSKEYDYFYYCSNKYCEHHEGVEAMDMDDEPTWVKQYG